MEGRFGNTKNSNSLPDRLPGPLTVEHTSDRQEVGKGGSIPQPLQPGSSRDPSAAGPHEEALLRGETRSGRTAPGGLTVRSRDMGAGGAQCKMRRQEPREDRPLRGGMVRRDTPLSNSFHYWHPHAPHPTWLKQVIIFTKVFTVVSHSCPSPLPSGMGCYLKTCWRQNREDLNDQMGSSRSTSGPRTLNTKDLWKLLTETFLQCVSPLHPRHSTHSSLSVSLPKHGAHPIPDSEVKSEGPGL